MQYAANTTITIMKSIRLMVRHKSARIRGCAMSMADGGAEELVYDVA